MNFREYLKETSFPGRAWSGKLKHIDNLLSWMYDKNIMTAGEKKKKDSLFNQYYRWYNDGDLPRGFGEYRNTKSKYSHSYPQSVNDRVEKHIEKEIEDFIKKILGKYSGKIDRGNFRYDKQIESIDSVISGIDNDDVYRLINYYKKSLKNEDALDMIEVLSYAYNELDKTVNDFIDSNRAAWIDAGIKSYEIPGNGYNIRYRIEKIEILNGSVPTDIEEDWESLKDMMAEIKEILVNVKSALEKAKALRLSS